MRVRRKAILGIGNGTFKVEKERTELLSVTAERGGET